MLSKQANTSHHESKILLDICVETDVKFMNSSQANNIELLLKK
jgi:hypothetical protein